MSKKCVVKDGKFVEPCETLMKASRYGNPKKGQQGIWCWSLISMETGGKSRTFFGVQSGEFKDKGLAFNCCPFCGERIDAPFNDK